MESGEAVSLWVGEGRVGDLGASVNHTSLQVWAESRSPGTISQASAPRTTGTPRTSLPHFHHPGRFTVSVAAPFPWDLFFPAGIQASYCLPPTLWGICSLRNWLDPLMAGPRADRAFPPTQPGKWEKSQSPEGQLQELWFCLGSCQEPMNFLPSSIPSAPPHWPGLAHHHHIFLLIFS